MRCPFCCRNLAGTSVAYQRKHIARCARSIRPKYIYSERKRGRPTEKERREILEKRKRE